jgi:hypothetical protein
MHAANDYGKSGEVPAWIKRQHHLYPSADLDEYQIASLTAQGIFCGRCSSDVEAGRIKMEVEDIDIGRLDIETGMVWWHKYFKYLR